MIVQTPKSGKDMLLLEYLYGLPFSIIILNYISYGCRSNFIL